jgi:hypothetical protein
MIVRVDNLVGECSLLLILLEFPHFNQEITDILNQLLQCHKSNVIGIIKQFSQDRVLAVSITIEEIDNTQ